MRLTKKQKFAAAIVENGTIKDASKACGISESTGYRWSKDDEIKAAVRDIKKSKMRAISAYMTKAGEIATQVIMKLVQDEDIAPQTRLQACMFIIKTGFDRLDIDDLQKRLEAVEQYIEDQK